VTVRDATLGRSAVTISAWNALSRVTGFARVLALGAALGTTFLGNTYQSANLVSTVLFELLAAGLLSAPLVPAFVALLHQGRGEDVERLAGTLLAVSLASLGAVTVVLLVARHDVMRLLTVGVADPAVRLREVRVGAFFLWFFVPQLLLYAVGAVAGAVLNAHRRFSAAAFAPVANNVVVIATMAVFVAMAGGGAPGLDVGRAPRLVLALGTTGGVLAMSAVPVLALVRAGTRLRPRLDLDHPQLRAVRRLGLWGMVLLAGTQLLIAVTVVLANRVEGGVIAYQIAYTFFLLPVALVAHPIFTALYPALAAHAQTASWDAFANDLAAALRRTALLVLPAAALLVALAQPALGLVRLGALHAGDARLVGRVLVAYAAGLAGYAVFLLLARAATAAGDAAAPALVGLGVAGGGALLMVVAALSVTGGSRVVALGLAHSVAYTVGAGALVVLVQRRLPRPLAVGPTLARAGLAAAGVWAAATVCCRAVGGQGRVGAALDVSVGGLVAVAAGVVVLWALKEPEVRALAARWA
jgi:putative peptidoglycan lipid II flippase